MSGLNFSKGSSSSSSQPWEPQQEFLLGAWNRARNLVQRGPMEGDWGVNPNELQLDASRQGQRISNMYTNVGQRFNRLGSSLMGGFGQAQDYYANQLNDPYAAYQQAANDPSTQAAVQSIMRDPYRQLTEQVNPAVAMNAAATGNSGSSRRAMTDAINQRGFDDRLADVTHDVTMANIGRQDTAANQLFGMSQTGADLIGQGAQYRAMAPEVQAQWGDYRQGLRQQDLDYRRMKYDAPLDYLGMYSNIVQANNWGGKTSGSSSSMGLSL